MNRIAKVVDNKDKLNNNLNSASQFSVAPMLKWTDRHCRYFHRKLSRRCWLYTEMVTTGAIIHGNNLERFIKFNPEESPVVLQLGGYNSKDLAKCAKLGEEYGYDEINLNVGCPSDRVQNNLIGACLMAQPKLVAEAVSAMRSAVDIPVTVKTRIGIDEMEYFDNLTKFVDELVMAGVSGIIIHARKAWLQGLSPKENRKIPPLRYEMVHDLKKYFIKLPIAINGGIHTPSSGLKHLSTWEGHLAVDGVMLGRAIYENPYLLTEVDKLYYAEEAERMSRFEVVESMFPYIESHLKNGGKLSQVTRHMLGLFHSQPGGKIWRRYLSQNAYKQQAGIEVLQNALVLLKSRLKNHKRLLL